MKRWLLLSAVLHAAVIGGLAIFAYPLRPVPSAPIVIGLVESTPGAPVGRQEQRHQAMRPEPATQPPDAPPAVSRVSAIAKAPSMVLVRSATGEARELSIEEYRHWLAAANEQPVYPRISRIRGEQGRIEVRVVLLRLESRPERVELAVGSGYEMLDRAVLEKIRQWRFQPFDGSEERLTLVFPFRFALDES